ncbi:MAG: GSCFA domain-containing protein [Burkholderiaceae bacterium]
MSRHPYQDIPAASHWRRGVAAVAPEQLDPVGPLKFTLRRDDRVATAGSCFAQHIARHLRRGGFNYHVTERGHPIASPDLQEQFNYGVFSARYGNVYSSRQLNQLFDRAYGHFSPQESAWQDADGHWVDPFRPTVEPGGFASREELLADRAQHLQAVRQLFETLDHFVFTLGLTECWHARSDGAVFPVCPGVAGGRFDAQAYALRNLTVAEVVADLESFRAKLKGVNPAARMILTVSPVPLMATMEPRHVLVSTAASKAILRAAADQLDRGFDDIAYFPSYEIITSAASRGRYFDADLRSVTEAGVQHVMRLFLAHAADPQPMPAIPAPDADADADADAAASGHARDSDAVVRTLCDEDLL